MVIMCDGVANAVLYGVGLRKGDPCNFKVEARRFDQWAPGCYRNK